MGELFTTLELAKYSPWGVVLQNVHTYSMFPQNLYVLKKRLKGIGYSSVFFL